MDNLFDKIAISLDILLLTANWHFYNLMGADDSHLWDMEREINSLKRARSRL